MRSIHKHQKADTLIQTLCDAPGKPRGDLKTLTNELPSPSFSGKLQLARMGSASHTMKGNLRKYYAELRGNMIYLHSEDTASMNCVSVRASARMMLEASYCSELHKEAAVNAAKGGLAANKEILVQIEKMTASHMLALYARSGVYWCQFETTGELKAWQQAITAELATLEDQQKRMAKAAAFVKLEPLVWHQLVVQAEAARSFLTQLSVYTDVDMSLERAREKLNGWLYMRQSVDDMEDGDVLSEEGWTYLFAGLNDANIYFFENEHAVLPCDLISLEHASLRLAGLSGSGEGFAFSLSTPLRTLELRVRTQEQLDDWSENIMQVQGAVGRAKLIPKHHRRARPFKSIRQRKYQVTPTETEPILNTFSDCFMPVVSSLLSDPKMSKLVREIAEEQEATAELSVLLDVSDSMGTTEPVWMLRNSQIKSLPSSACEALEQLRISSKASLEAAEAGSPAEIQSVRNETLMQRAYNAASERLQNEVLPLVYESETYSTWAKQQLVEETREVQLLSLVQSKPLHAALVAQLTKTAPTAAPALAALALIEQLLGMPPGAARAALGHQLIESHLQPGAAHPPPGLSDESKGKAQSKLLPEALAKPEEEREAIEMVIALKAVLKELRTVLVAPLEHFLGSTAYCGLAAAAAEEQLARNGFMHFAHCAAGLEPLRAFLLEQRANENIDFFKQVLAFKRIDDLFATKAAAGMINDKFLSEGAPSQVALPGPILREIEAALQPKFPHPNTFDKGVDHVLNNLRHEVWPQFKTSAAFAETAAAVRASLPLSSSDTGASPKVLLAVRQGHSRHCVAVAKKVVVVGKSTESDLILVNAPETAIGIEACPAEKGGGFKVALLWTTMHSNATEGSTGITVVTTNGQHVGSGENFHIGALEAALFSIAE